MGDNEQQVRRYDHPIEVWFGNKNIEAAPLRGVDRIRAFERGLVEEVLKLQARVEQHARGGTVSPEALLEVGIDSLKLLRLGLPDVITDELLGESTARERLGLLTDVCYLNNLGRFTPFLLPEMLLELGSRLNRELPLFPGLESSTSFSEPASVGAPSSES